jgi:hypothetical protein
MDESITQNESLCYIGNPRWGEPVHPLVKWAAWMFLFILIFIGVGGLTGVVPMYMQPMLLHILVPSFVILGVVVIVGLFKSFDRSGWIVILSVLALFLLIGILSLISNS